MLRTGQLLAPSQGRRCSASTAGSRPPPGAALPGTLASPRTGLTPAGCHELLARLRRPPPFSLTPELLDARGMRKLVWWLLAVTAAAALLRAQHRVVVARSGTSKESALRADRTPSRPHGADARSRGRSRAASPTPLGAGPRRHAPTPSTRHQPHARAADVPRPIRCGKASSD